MTSTRRSRSIPSTSASVSSLTPPVSRSSLEATCASCSTSRVPAERANPCPTGAILSQAVGTASNLRLTISAARSRRCATRRRTSATRSWAAEAASRSCLRTPPATPSNFSNPQGTDAAPHRCWTGATELPRIPVLRHWVNRVYLCRSGLLVEDVLDLLEGVSRENVSDPQIRRSRILARVQGVAGYEHRTPRCDGPRFAVDGDRAGSFEDEVDLGLVVPVLAQRLSRGYHRDAHGERFALGEVSAYECFPVDQAPFCHLLVWPRFPLTSTFLNDDRFTIHPLTSLADRWSSKDSFSI